MRLLPGCKLGSGKGPASFEGEEEGGLKSK
jgi:hypothetical protein